MDPAHSREYEAHPADTPETRLPSLPARLLAVFLSPGRLTEQLAANPRWLGALLVSAAIVGISMALIPADLFFEVQRQAAMERGVDLPEMGAGAMRFMRIIIPVTTVITTLLFSFVFAGVYTLIFAFILGDEGRFTQYLAMVTHAWFIAAVLGLLVTPLRISTGDPQFSLNMGSFFPFLDDGYLQNVLKVLDLTQIWSTLVIAQGAHAIDRRRGFVSAASIMLGILLVFALIVARFI